MSDSQRDGEATASLAPGIVDHAGAPVSLTPGDTLIDEPERYEVERAIGAGGMGTVVAAKGERFGRSVAIKMITVDRDDLRRRFEREARVTARLQHPAIIPVYSGGRRDGLPFYAMKQVSGDPLDKVIAGTTTLAERIALLPKVIAVTEAIAYAHAEKVIHRDLKPANILVGKFGETIIIDWGLAKDLASNDDDAPVAPYRASGAEHTAVGQVLGTPAYMPREQARGESVDERADVYALGAILYHLLAGTAPFRRPDEGSVPWESMLARVLSGPPAALATLQPDAPPDLLAIVNRAMSMSPDARYPSAAELAEDLRRFQTGQLVGAHRYSSWQLVRRWLKRHRTAVSVGGVLAAMLVVVSIVSVQRIRHERSDAENARATAESERGKAVESRGEAEDLMGFMLGDLKDKLVPVGRLDILDAVAKKSMAYYQKHTDTTTDDERGKRAKAYFNVGDVLMPQGNVDGALQAYRAALAIREGLATNDDGRADLAATHYKIGDALYVKGDGKAALLEYRAGLAKAEQAAAGDPHRLEFQHQLSIAHDDIGDVLIDQGDVGGALAEYAASRDIRTKLLAAEPANTRWMRNLSIASVKAGTALVSKGDLDGALDMFRTSKSLLEKASNLDPNNAQWKRDLQVAMNRLGEHLKRLGKPADALVEYRGALEIAEAMAKQDPTNAEWTRDLGLAHLNFGDAVSAMNDHKGALAEYHLALDNGEKLTLRDPANAQWRHDLVIIHQRLSRELDRTADFDGALKEAQAAGKEIEALISADPNSISYQIDLGANYQLMGAMLTEQNTEPKVRASIPEFRAAVDQFQKIADRNPTDMEAQRRLANVLQNLGDSYITVEDPTAISIYAQASAILDKLIAAQPGAHHEVNKLMIHVNLAELAQKTRHGDARAEYLAAAEIAAQLVRADPKNAQFLALQAEVKKRLDACCPK
jgi:serine/threonine protein kinase/Flp pilus assembly protein TadD